MEFSKGDLIKIKIKKKDIRKGIRHNCGECPSALALRRKLTKMGIEWTILSVGDTLTAFKTSLRPEDLVTLTNPEAMRMWIEAFDEGWEMQPSTFLLEVT